MPDEIVYIKHKEHSPDAEPARVHRSAYNTVWKRKGWTLGHLDAEGNWVEGEKEEAEPAATTTEPDTTPARTTRSRTTEE